ncbi:MAG: hypothetical protein JW993_17880 [Sedimentisphaerales bacterium]|nr:hypothetical protein [Sedimentisphaerales bacterium]
MRGLLDQLQQAQQAHIDTALAQLGARKVSEIAAASQEQAQGIDQVNTAVAQMDKVTQQNAANAEESASASEQLSAQAETLNEAIGQLVALVGGARGKKSRQRDQTAREPAGAVPTASKRRDLGVADHTWHRIADSREPVPAPPAKPAPVRNPIPLDSDEAGFDDFND